MTTTILIGAARALVLLRETVAEHGPSTVYVPPRRGDCVYEHDGHCSCLVGTALHHEGVTVEQLKAMDDWADGDSAIDEVQLPEGVELTEAARRIFRAAQVQQDYRNTWGEALAAAEATAAQLGVTQ